MKDSSLQMKVAYTTGQANAAVAKPNQPVYTIAYRSNPPGNLYPSNVLTGAPAATYVTAMRNQLAEVDSLCSDGEANENHYQLAPKGNQFQKVS